MGNASFGKINLPNFGKHHTLCLLEKEIDRIRLEPRYTWRQLGQQRQELPGSVPQQLAPRQPQQQRRFPPAEHTPSKHTPSKHMLCQHMLRQRVRFTDRARVHKALSRSFSCASPSDASLSDWTNSSKPQRLVGWTAWLFNSKTAAAF